MDVFGQVRIAPSLLSADFMNMENAVRMIEDAGAGFAHVDVMDGHFVPNLTVGVPFVRQLKGACGLPLDVHLMITNPLEQIPWFLEAGADWLTFHIEAFPDASPADVGRAISLIRDAGAHPGISLRPATPASAIQPFLPLLDMVGIMSVNPGFSGQSFIEGSEARIAEVVSMARAAGVCPLISVDGGIDCSTAAAVGRAGADVLVAGNAVFKAADPAAAIAEIARLAQAAQEGGETPRRAACTDPATRPAQDARAAQGR
ncbi:MAG: ribulose-phosphate 3-epimerase [Eggerthellaceae bacterium]|nr:ribulose-phosphate 3-epimerase [Eggerthellaceae bacterium]